MSVVRSTMAQLIALSRLRVGDPAGAAQFFADSDIQDKLDECRMDVQYETLDPRPTLANGTITWTDYYADREFWESDTTLVWGNYTVLTPDVSDFIVGHWVFNAGQYPPVFIRGKTYDLWRVCADLLEERAAGLALTAWNFSSDGQTISRNQQYTNLMTLAATYRRRARAISYDVSRADATSDRENKRRAAIGSVSEGVPFVTGP